MAKTASNKRVVGSVGQWFLSEPYGSNFGWFAFWRDRSDPAAHGKHYVQPESFVGLTFKLN